MGTLPERIGRAGTRARLGLVSVTALLWVGPALGHPALSPASVNAGAATRVVVQIPNERAGRHTVGLTLTLPAGFTVIRAEDEGGWKAAVDDRSAAWQGGRISGEATVDFALELRAIAPAGTYEVALDQRYDDGRSVRTAAPIVVLPAVGDAAPAQHLGRAVVAGAVGVLVVIGTLVGLRLLRRRQAPR